MDIHVSTEENGVVLSIQGRLDSLSMEQFSQSLDPYLANGQGGMTLDFQSVEYISSGGLRVIMNAVRTLQKQDRKLQITNVSPNVYSLLELTGFNNFISITKTE